MLFQKDNISIRYVIEEDAPIISKWLTDPEVLKYYEGRDNPQSVEMVLNHFIHNPNSHEKRCLIAFDAVPIGYIQMYPIDSEWKTLYGYEESQNVWGMDQFIGEPTYWGKGIGTKLVQAAITYIMENTGAEAIAMDPNVNNERAIKCYEKYGFKKVKILKEHELHEAIAPQKGDRIVEKTTPDSFHKTNLNEVLQEKGIEHVIISGMQTEYCVDTTTRRAFSEGYKVTLVRDAHSTFDTEVLRAEDIVKHHNVVFGAFANVVALKDLKVTASK
ncbi:isochorismatase family protein [Bacillus pretiosus]|uniref:isochorismatase family protein n=1 Tax=Bacillus pretiosus TaxID=2983392 RepID=UPI003D64810E